MSEDEAVFDPSLKKKKKKKKTPFDIEAAMDGPGVTNEDGQEEDSVKTAAVVEEDDIDLESFGKKKKKKKKVTEEIDGQDEAEAVNKDVEPVDDDIDLESFGKKKKKKKGKLDMGELGEALPGDDDDVDLENFGVKKKKKKRPGNRDPSDLDAKDEEDKENEDTNPWTGSDRDYTYDELLQRVFGIIRDKNPEMAAGEPKRFVMRPPQVVRVGTKKTAFVNFTEIAKMLRRQPKHLLAFLSAELGANGTVDGNNQLIMKGRFQQKHIENVLRRYIMEYVTCHTCRSPDTILNKETRLFFLQCMTCHSRCSVQTIKTGFQAVTGSRRVMRAKQ